VPGTGNRCRTLPHPERARKPPSPDAGILARPPARSRAATSAGPCTHRGPSLREAPAGPWTARPAGTFRLSIG
jgi:hypothetical protein